MNAITCSPCTGSIDSAECFGAAVGPIMPLLRGYSRRLTHDDCNGDDLVQDTLARAWRARASFQPSTNIKAWLFRIARNCFLSGLRRSARSVQWDPDFHDRLLVSGASQEEGLYMRDLDLALLDLPVAQREALLTIVQDGLSYEAAAERLGLELGTMKSRVARARASVMRFLSDGRPPPQPAMPAAANDPVPAPQGTIYQRWKQSGSRMIGRI